MNPKNQDMHKLLFSAADLVRGELVPTSAIELFLYMLLVKRVADLAGIGSTVPAEVDLSFGKRQNSKLCIDPTIRWDRLLASKAPERELEQMLRTLAQLNPDVLRELVRTAEISRYPVRAIERYVHYFQRYNLAEIDPLSLGDAIDETIDRLSTTYGRGEPIFGLPMSIQQLLREFSNLLKPLTVADPNSNTGSVLSSVATGFEYANVHIAGQEQNAQAWRFCKLSLMLRGIVDADIQLGNSLRDPLLRDGFKLRTYDMVISNPPWNQPDWGVETASLDPYGRYPFGIPPRSTADFAYIQNAIAHANETGHALVLTASGPLFRGGVEREIRKNIIGAGLVEAVIQLPSNVMHHTSLPVSLIVFSKKKPATRKGMVLFVAAQRCGTPLDRRRIILRSEDIDRIVKAYQQFDDEPDFCKVASLDEIEKNDFVLSVSRYVRVEAEIERVSIEDEQLKLASIEERRMRLESELDDILRGFNLG